MRECVNMYWLGYHAKIQRKKRGLTQTDVANALGCDIRSISMFECGHSQSWKIISWYLLNDLLSMDIIRGCSKHGKTASQIYNRQIN